MFDISKNIFFYDFIKYEYLFVCNLFKKRL